MNFTPGHWLVGWLLAGTMIGVGLLRGLTLLWVGGIAFCFVWWYAPEILYFILFHHWPARRDE